MATGWSQALSALIGRDRTPPQFHSRFGGLWIDRSDWRREARRRGLTPVQLATVSRFVEDGYVILPQAADLATVDAFRERVAKSFREGDSSLLYQDHGSGQTRRLTEPLNPLGARVVDSYMAIPSALDLFTSPALIAFLEVLFGEPALLFQSLSFDQGSQQGLHQDTAYVVVDRPLELAACWIALEDVQVGSGELMYAPGSHRNPDFDFGSGAKHWDGDRDGQAAHDRWSSELRSRAAEGRGIETFIAKKGDILVWHADLAHGGSPVVRPELTRRSLVGHFCPRSARPNYRRDRSDSRGVLTYGALSYCSGHYPEPD